ncbi:MAG: glycosyltransferase family 1 protein [Bacteroidetes bacterium]|nr:MAG: glycosyltransferase family 1 protein [Bacteroidota bacterium]
MSTPPTPPACVAFVSNSIRYLFTHRFDAINAFRQNGYRVLILAPQDIPVPEFNQAGIEHVPIAFSNKSLSVADAWTLHQTLVRLYRQHRPQVAFHYAIKVNIFGNFAAARAGVACVSIIAGIGYAFQKSNWLSLLVQQLYSRALRLAKEVWFVNPEDAELFLQKGLVPVDKMVLLNSEGINTAKFCRSTLSETYTPEVPFTFCCTTRPLYSKGIETIIEAIKILKAKGHAVQFVLAPMPDAGHPDEISLTQLQAWETAGLLRLASFTLDVRPLLAASHCFLLPSFYNEGVPQSLLEAASMELPIITTNQKGCKESIVEGQTGLFCQSRNPQHLAEQMEHMLLLPTQTRLAMGRAGRRLMQEKFDIARICAQYLRVAKS